MLAVHPPSTPWRLILVCVMSSLLLHAIGLISIRNGIKIAPAAPLAQELILQTEMLSEVPPPLPLQTAPSPALATSPARGRVAPARPVPRIEQTPRLDPALNSQTDPPPEEAFAVPEPIPHEPQRPAVPFESETSSSLASTADPLEMQQPVNLVRSAVLEYSVAYGVQDNTAPQAISTVRWQSTEDKFEIESVSQATGLTSLLVRGTLTETSVGHITPQGLAPVRYGEKRASRGERAIHFQRERQVLSFSNRQEEVALPPGVQDRLALRYQLGWLLQANPSLQQAGSVLEVPVATPSGVDRWRMVVRKHETLHTETGDFQTLYLVREKRPDRVYDQSLEVWIAPSVFWLPIRVRIVDATNRSLDAVLIKTQVQEK